MMKQQAQQAKQEDMNESECFVARVNSMCSAVLHQYLLLLANKTLKASVKDVYEMEFSLMPYLEFRFRILDRDYRVKLVIAEQPPPLPASLDENQYAAIKEHMLAEMSGVIQFHFTWICQMLVKKELFFTNMMIEYSADTREFTPLYINVEEMQKELTKKAQDKIMNIVNLTPHSSEEDVRQKYNAVVTNENLMQEIQSCVKQEVYNNWTMTEKETAVNARLKQVKERLYLTIEECV